MQNQVGKKDERFTDYLPVWSDFYDDWFCTPLFRLPEDVT